MARCDIVVSGKIFVSKIVKLFRFYCSESG
jgi:hypothetical protein